LNYQPFDHIFVLVLTFPKFGKQNQQDNFLSWQAKPYWKGNTQSTKTLEDNHI